jgi:methyl-accepting chemotaxis protein
MSNNKTTSGSSLSISTKIDLALAILFLLVLVTSSINQYNSETALIEQIVQDQTNTLADSYFDNVNTLMLTGGMANKEIARKKVVSRDDVLDAYIVRGQGVISAYGAGTGPNKVKDELDRRGMKGEVIDQIVETANGRILSVVLPMKALKDYRGTNCLMCHVVPEGEVIGAVRVDYSLKAMDDKVFKEILKSVGTNAVLFLIGLVIISFIMKKLVVRPLKKITDTIRLVEHDSDLHHQIELESNDELGNLAKAINIMLQKFQHIIDKVAQTTNRLVSESQRLSNITDQSIQGCQRQQRETEQVATAMTEMEQTAANVAQNAVQAANSTQEADKQATEGSAVVNSAVTTINALADEVTEASEVIRKLEEDSEGIGRVVEVITNIAEQTNLLALNAAIEAARAGEQGRGFAVVADEVRTLATRTHESTQEIQSMIESLQQQARGAASVMNRSREKADSSVSEAARAGSVLNEIAVAVGTITEMNNQISVAASEQSAVSAEMSKNVVSINEVSDQTAANSQLISNASDVLTDLAENLQVLVNQFKT